MISKPSLSLIFYYECSERVVRTDESLKNCTKRALPLNQETSASANEALPSLSTCMACTQSTLAGSRSGGSYTPAPGASALRQSRARRVPTRARYAQNRSLEPSLQTVFSRAPRHQPARDAVSGNKKTPCQFCSIAAVNEYGVAVVAAVGRVFWVGSGPGPCSREAAGSSWRTHRARPRSCFRRSRASHRRGGLETLAPRIPCTRRLEI